MKLWVGLGNPGDKHASDRHNIGFMALDAIANHHGFEPFSAKFSGLFAQGRIGGEKVALLKPTTFMNKSGVSVQKAMAFFKIPLENVTVFHDELDLAPGKMRVKTGGGLAGHNGLKSINQMCGGQDFDRVRLGIGHPGHKDRVAGYVLSGFAKDEIALRDDMSDGCARYAEHLAAGELDLFQTRVAEYVAR